MGWQAVPARAQSPDFNGDGFGDLAVGVPSEGVGTPPVSDAGLVHVLYGSADGVSVVGDQVWTQNSDGIANAAEADDQFGGTLAWGDFNGDGFDDLAVGVPGEGVGASASHAGAVNVLYGSAAGLSSAGNQFWHQNSTGILDDAETEDGLGAALAGGDFDADGFDDLAVGVPSEDLGALDDAGAVHVLYGSSSGLSSTGSQFWNQNSLAISGAAEQFDAFGSALAVGDFDGDGFDDLAAGIPQEDEDLTIPLGSGAVSVIYGSASGLTLVGDQLWHQNSSGVPDPAEVADAFGESLTAGDFDGDGVADLAIGILREDVGSITDAGAVNVLYGSLGSGLAGAGGQFWHQSSTGILDGAQESDRFGQALAAGDFDGDGADDLAVGVPWEDVVTFSGSFPDAGVVNVIYGSGAGLTEAGDQLWNQSSLLSRRETNDLFGWAVTTADFDDDGFADLAVGAPSENLAFLDVGAVNVVYGAANSGLSPTGNQFLHQDTPGVLETAEEFDGFGHALPGVVPILDVP
jgi:hypothetical protein